MSRLMLFPLLWTLLPAGALAEEPAAEPAEENAVELTLAQTKLTQRIESQLDYYSSKAKEACGVEVAIDWPSFVKAGKLDGLPSTIASACQGAVWGAAEVCGDPAAKAAFGKRAQSIVCTHVADKKSTGLELADGALRINVHVVDTGATSAPASYKAVNRPETLGWLEKKL